MPVGSKTFRNIASVASAAQRISRKMKRHERKRQNQAAKEAMLTLKRSKSQKPGNVNSKYNNS